jgi:hypothetical protein
MIPAEWPPRFQPHDRVIDLLVGPQLYTSTDVAVRELLQNAQDACVLAAVDGDGYGPRITVAYSPSENWCEFRDNGLGMNRESIQGSFAWIGAPKTEVIHIRERLAKVPPEQRQIAYFGIGILSCFGVASSVELSTKMDGDEPIALQVADYHEPFVELAARLRDRGTTVRLVLKTDGPMKATDIPLAVRRYARHTPHVWLANADSGVEELVEETWLTVPENSIQAEIAADNAILSGRLALDPAWLGMGSTFGAELVTCNGGFLVSEHDLDLLPGGTTGFRGEVNVTPGALTILMNREGFKRDEAWKSLSTQLGKLYGDLLIQLLNRYDRMLQDTAEPTDAVERAMILLSRSGIRGLVAPEVGRRVDALLPRTITLGERGSTKRFTLATVRDKVGPDGVVFVVREDEAQQQRTKSFSDADSGSAIQVMETVNTTSWRAMQLQAAGYLVVSCRQRDIPHATAPGGQNLRVHEFDILSQFAQTAGFRVQSVNDAPADIVALSPLPESELITGILEAGEGIRIVYLPTSPSRVVPDFTGRLLNAAHPDIQALLKVIPAAIGNPVLRTLIQTYIDIDSWDYSKARQRLKSLLDDPELADKAQLVTPSYLREYLERRLGALGRMEVDDE